MKIKPNGFTQSKLPLLRAFITIISPHWKRVLIIGAEHIDPFLSLNCVIVDIDQTKLLPFGSKYFTLCRDVYNPHWILPLKELISEFDAIYINLHGGVEVAKLIQEVYPKADLLIITTNNTISKFKELGIVKKINFLEAVDYIVPAALIALGFG